MPTDKEGYKFYCGDKYKLPETYDYYGGRHQCLKTGVGVGLYVLGGAKARAGGEVRAGGYVTAKEQLIKRPPVELIPRQEVERRERNRQMKDDLEMHSARSSAPQRRPQQTTQQGPQYGAQAYNMTLNALKKVLQKLNVLQKEIAKSSKSPKRRKVKSAPQKGPPRKGSPYPKRKANTSGSGSGINKPLVLKYRRRSPSPKGRKKSPKKSRKSPKARKSPRRPPRYARTYSRY